MFSVRCTVSLVYLSPLAALVAAPPQILQIVFTGTCSHHSVAAVDPSNAITGGHPTQPPHPFGGEGRLCLHWWEEKLYPPPIYLRLQYTWYSEFDPYSHSQAIWAEVTTSTANPLYLWCQLSIVQIQEGVISVLKRESQLQSKEICESTQFISRAISVNRF